MKTKEISQMKPRLSHGRAGVRCKIKTLIPPNKPVVQTTESLTKVFTPKSPKAQDAVIPIPSYAIPQMQPRGDISSRKTIEDMSREILIYPDAVY